MKRLILTVAAAAMTLSLAAQNMPKVPAIPTDKELRTGVLENGMKYYVRHNAKQKNLADFYIVHDVGAIQEDDNQQGLAHFLEHMAFNGTKNMPGKMIIDYMEKVGVKFGANLNASTSWDVTQYLLKDVPTVREGIIDSAMLVLHDWSHFISLEPKEIDSERGVIMEELRTRDGASWRSTIQMLKAVGKGSRYENRNLIGYLDGLKSFTYNDIRSFYETWYRPEHQAVIIVGDIDADQIVEKLKKLMADIPHSPEGVREKEVIVIPDNEEPIISILADPEAQESSASIYYKRKAMPKALGNTVIAANFQMLNSLAMQMANARLQEISMKPDAPFTSAGFRSGAFGICPTLDCVSISVSTKDGELEKGMDAVLKEVKKIKQFGFTDSELERAKANTTARLKRSYMSRNDRRNQNFVRNYISAFRRNSAVPDAKTDWEIDSAILAKVDVSHINKLMEKFISDNNQVYIINTPKKDGIKDLSEADVKGIIAGVAAAQVEAYKDDVVKRPLIANEAALKGSKVKSVAENEALGVTEWTLKNGLKIRIKPTKYQADAISLQLRANAGLCTVSDADYANGEYMASFLGSMGVGEFSAQELRKQLSGKTASVQFSVTDYSAEIAATSSVKDFETALQLMYLQFTAPRFSEQDFQTQMTKYRAYVDNLAKNPDFTASKVMNSLLYNNHPRSEIISSEMLDKLSLEKMKQIYRQIFSSSRNFTLNIVGNIDMEVARPLVEKYIGSLPQKGAQLKKTDTGMHKTAGVVEKDFRTPMQQPKVGVYRYFHGPVEYTLKNTVVMTFLSQALSSRYLISIREEKGGTYGVRVRGNIEPDYTPEYNLNIQFDTNEQMADELSEIVMKELRKIAQEGPLASDVEKTRTYLLKNFKNRLESNPAWFSFINGYYNRGINQPADYEQTVKDVTYEEIQKFAQKVLSDNNMTYMVMRPEAK